MRVLPRELVIVAAVLGRSSALPTSNLPALNCLLQAPLKEAPAVYAPHRSSLAQRVLRIGRGGGSEAGSPPSSEKAAVGRVMGVPSGGASKADIGHAARIVVDLVSETAILLGLLQVALVVLPAKLGDEITESSLKIIQLVTWGVVAFLSSLFGLKPTEWLSSRLQLLNWEQTINENFYDSLKKPRWHPPKWLFPVMWIPLKMLQVFSCYGVWRECGDNVLAPSIVTFLVYKCLGDIWNKVFFERQLLGWGAAVISAYWLVLVSAVALFNEVSPASAALLAPTALWVTVAGTLNISIWRLNRKTA